MADVVGDAVFVEALQTLRLHAGVLELAGDLVVQVDAVLLVRAQLAAKPGRQRSVRQFMGEMLQEYAQLMIPVIEEGSRNGEFRAVSAPDVAMTLIAFYEGLILLWVVDPRAIHWRDQAERSLRLMLDGIAAQRHDAG